MSGRHFEVVRLNRWSPHAWGVIGETGWLAANADRRVRMRRSEACDLARLLNVSGASTEDPFGRLPDEAVAKIETPERRPSSR